MALSMSKAKGIRGGTSSGSRGKPNSEEVDSYAIAKAKKAFSRQTCTKSWDSLLITGLSNMNMLTSKTLPSRCLHGYPETIQRLH